MNSVAHDMRILGRNPRPDLCSPPKVRVYWSLANLGHTVPPRNPDDDDEPEDEEGDERDDDLDPAVIREPDE